MKIALISLLVTVAAGANIPYGMVQECAGKVAGTKMYVGNDCTRYAICQPAGLSFIETCQTGLVYNLQKDMCDWPANVPQCTAGSVAQQQTQNMNQWSQQQYYPQQQQYPQYYQQQQQNHYPQQYPQKYW